MNAHALSVLEFGRALDAVAARAGSPMARDRILALMPGTDRERIRARLARVSEARMVLEARPDWAPPPIPDARDALETLGVEGSALDPSELLSVRRLLQASRELAAGLTRAIDDIAESAGGPVPLQTLRALLPRLPENPGLEEEIDGTVDDEGEVRDGASHELRAVRRRLRSARSAVVRKLEQYLGELPDSYRVEGASVSVRDGRYVVPIRREGRSQVGGIIRGESATGVTLFVEPPLAIRLMNELHELERDESTEVQRILREATSLIRPSIAELRDGFEAQVDFDTRWARALTARAWGGVAPDLGSSDDDRLEIVAGRHPLLLEQGVEVVPFFLQLNGDERVVVVSGPNTGGKTVLLKAVGLIHLLAQAGVIPPVEAGTRLPVARDVFADIGDEQSIAESLSTFSAHLANAREILAGAGPGALVLMDELGTGTDPNEGAALARAMLELLVERGARALVTSHLGALKRLDGEGSGIVNASLLFDSDRIAPTYQFQKGRPGRSFGLAIARRLGLPNEVLDRAESYVDSSELKMEALLENLEQKERELAEAVQGAETARHEAVEIRADAEAREARVEERERSLERRAREQARDILLEARGEVEAAIREVRALPDGDEGDVATRARRRVEEAVEAQRQRAPEQRPTSAGRLVESFAEGDRVKVRGSGARGIVRELRDERVTIEVGGLRLEVPRSEVQSIAPGPTEPAESRRGSAAARSGGSWSAPEFTARHEIDLRGLRVDEVDLALGRALDAAVVENLSELRVIHGKGTGAVRARVHEMLDADSRIESFRPGRPGEGGAGVTVVEIR